MLNGNMLCTDGARALMAAVKANSTLTYLGLQVSGTDSRDNVPTHTAVPLQQGCGLQWGCRCSRAAACSRVAPCAGVV